MTKPIRFAIRFHCTPRWFAKFPRHHRIFPKQCLMAYHDYQTTKHVLRRYHDAFSIAFDISALFDLLPSRIDATSFVVFLGIAAITERA
jgi:hypothetical protein